MRLDPSGRYSRATSPPDKGQCSYQATFNAFKRIASSLSEAEKTALFSQTATEFYRSDCSHDEKRGRDVDPAPSSSWPLGSVLEFAVEL